MLRDASARLPREWFVLADTDEFQNYPSDLKSIVAECQTNDWEFTRGLLVDRVAADGGFPSLDPAKTLAEQFPIGCIVTPIIQQGESRKVTLVHGALHVVYGQHHAPFGSGCPREVIFSPIDHFKWIAGMVEYMRRRAEQFRLEGRSHWQVSQNLVDHVDRNGGRFDLTMPQLLAGSCNPSYSRWEEYKEQAFVAEDELNQRYGAPPRTS